MGLKLQWASQSCSTAWYWTYFSTDSTTKWASDSWAHVSVLMWYSALQYSSETHEGRVVVTLPVSGFPTLQLCHSDFERIMNVWVCVAWVNWPLRWAPQTSWPTWPMRWATNTRSRSWTSWERKESSSSPPSSLFSIIIKSRACLLLCGVSAVSVHEGLPVVDHHDVIQQNDRCLRQREGGGAYCTIWI